MKKIKVLALCAIVAGFSISCEKKDVASEAQPEAVTETVSKAHLNALADAGVNTNVDIKYQMITGLPGDTPYEAVVVDNELIFAIDQLEKGIHKLENLENNAKQYRTNNLVIGSNRSFRVVGFTGSGNALTSKMRTGLQWAVNNYNRLNSTLNLTLVFQSTFTNSDMVVFNNNQSGGGGVAGFPFNGRAFNRVSINAGTDSFSTNVVEHVMTHEIGHSLGLRHTDYARRRCDNSNEGAGGSGAIFIPGTQSGNQFGGSNIDSNSIMISCFDSGEDGEFSSGDIIALETLY